MVTPSSARRSLGTPLNLSTYESGTAMPGTLFFMYFATPSDLSGVKPAMK
jgi:hypothetical protein